MRKKWMRENKTRAKINTLKVIDYIQYLNEYREILYLFIRPCLCTLYLSIWQKCLTARRYSQQIVNVSFYIVEFIYPGSRIFV